ncbi:5'/3'-nucleotidase SurE [Pseudoalteromonas sp. MMG012]|uniref:5'/3'-nucleotidase SurE n=1 Tax=Pseudoalteromonas sp. MMG012 TaxID=2822686 RepID=UPI001B3A446C|nr:5'/3'-nucleotidase SurE [Pseudoalteromonas sp. MMG012]MBQ4851546.1 5'/3'-nucleotidase SurE [Pseudoalteromonas sp. MMG012]
MRILLSNDDGVDAKGIAVLYRALCEIAEVIVIAPDRNCSGASHSLTLMNPLRVSTLDNGFLSVNGTPADCVHIGVSELMADLPDLVVAGINKGANLGDDTLYSGTVAAAIEGRHMGLPAIAVSLCSKYENHYDTAAQITIDIIKQLQSHPLPKDQIININVPDISLDELKGVKVCRLGKRHKAETMTKQTDPWGREVFWYGTLGHESDAGPGTDFHAINQGYAAVTPLKIDTTAHESLDAMACWLKR